jgi:hypothetical protein
MSGVRKKLQIPKSKLQRNFKLQAPIDVSLVIGASLDVGAWNLELFPDT